MDPLMRGKVLISKGKIFRDKARVKNGSIRPYPEPISVEPLFSKVLEDEASAPFLENLSKED